jgi:hypothetical protein
VAVDGELEVRVRLDQGQEGGLPAADKVDEADVGVYGPGRAFSVSSISATAP